VESNLQYYTKYQPIRHLMIFTIKGPFMLTFLIILALSKIHLFS
jgi:hypothetical protein